MDVLMTITYMKVTETQHCLTWEMWAMRVFISWFWTWVMLNMLLVTLGLLSLQICWVVWVAPSHLSGQIASLQIVSPAIVSVVS